MGIRRAMGAAMCVVLVGGVTTGAVGASEPGEPQLQLVRAAAEVKVYRYGGRASLDLGVFVAARGAPFELQVTRPDYSQPLVLEQVIHGPAGRSRRLLDPALLDEWSGLARFFKVEVKDGTGSVIRKRQLTFCPNGNRERISDLGPSVPTFPESCGANPFARGMVWGIDEEWASSTVGWDPPNVRLDPGRYEATMSVQEPYVSLFDLDPSEAAVSVSLVVRKGDGCRHCGHTDRRAAPTSTYSRAVPSMEDPDPALLPDLVSLPAWGISVRNRRSGRSYLTFGATVWAGGASPLVVEGFRQQDADVMDAYQYFLQDGEPVGRAPVGSLEFDNRKGHDHWHFLQFARYSLTGRDQSELIRSKKEAFCLAPTDAIDLTLENADRNPWEVGLGTACGSAGSLWVREILPLGWGDTYHQGIPGQSFNITKLPNGIYHIAVEANPGRLLHEQDGSNNIEYREVRLRGKPGARKVIVPPWNGIDSESRSGEHGGFM